jgi:acetyltransferase-like isoleucine patch superfamily enzyme
MIAKFVEIRTGDSHSIIDIQTGERINKAGNVILKDHVWLGAHIKVLKGVTLGENFIIGASSIVK